MFMLACAFAGSIRLQLLQEAQARKAVRVQLRATILIVSAQYKVDSLLLRFHADFGDMGEGLSGTNILCQIHRGVYYVQTSNHGHTSHKTAQAGRDKACSSCQLGGTI